MNTINYSLYLVTDSSRFEEEGFFQAVETALQNGVTLLQLREKELTSRAFYERALQVKKLTDHYDVPLIINDRIDIMQAVDAAGVHLGQADLPLKEARRMLGKDKIIGVSAKTVEQAMEAEKDGATYLGTGAINPTTTKVITQITAIATLKEICESVKIPVVAIGGINEKNAYDLIGTKIKGIAVVSAILAQKDIQAATINLTKVIKEVIQS